MVRDRHVEPNPNLQLESLFTTFQVGELLQVHPITVARWMDNGEYPVARTRGGHRRISAATVLAIARARSLPAPPVLRHLARPAIVFIDDEPHELKGVERLLRPYAERIVLYTVDNAIDGLMKIGEVQPSLVILDILMPGLNGIEACSRIRANPALKATRVLIVSSHLTTEAEASALAAGANRCLKKPLRARDILEMVGVDVTHPKPSPGKIR
ncbi:MAG: response regulator [Deltaproteobacteria bacterium]|nr:response regulator [Deltaproteobacteria bacterium]